MCHAAPRALCPWPSFPVFPHKPSPLPTPQLHQVLHLTLNPVWRCLFVSIVTPPHFPLCPVLPRPMPSVPVVCICKGGGGGGGGVSGWVHTWRPENNFGGVNFLFPPYGSWECNSGGQARPGGKHLYLMSHLTGPTLFLRQSFTGPRLTM